MSKKTVEAVADLPEETNEQIVEGAIHALNNELETNPVDEMRLYVFENMLDLLKDVPNQFETMAVARLALLGNVTGLVKQNANLMHLVQSTCEKFGITVKVTEINGTSVYERDLPIIANSQYDIKTLQMAMMALIAKVSSITFNSSVLEKENENYINELEQAKAEIAKLNGRIRDLSNVPLPPEVSKPYRLARRYIKDNVEQWRYITKDPTSGYKVTKHLSNALSWDNAEDALKRLVHLNQNALEYPIPNVHEYELVTLLAMANYRSKVSSEVQLHLAQARTRAEKNLGAK